MIITVSEFKSYLKVQYGGKWNMYTTEARLATGLTPIKYQFVMNNYERLRINLMNLLSIDNLEAWIRTTSEEAEEDISKVSHSH